VVVLNTEVVVLSTEVVVLSTEVVCVEHRGGGVEHRGGGVGSVTANHHSSGGNSVTITTLLCSLDKLTGSSSKFFQR